MCFACFDVQVLKERISWLEATNEDLKRELREYHNRSNVADHYESEVQVSYRLLSVSDFLHLI